MKITQFGSILRVYRAKNELTQYTMAEAIGVSSSFLSSVEKGQKRISSSIVDSLHKAYPDITNGINNLEWIIEISQPKIKFDCKVLDIYQIHLLVELKKNLSSLGTSQITEMLKVLHNDS